MYEVELEEPLLAELVRVIKVGLCIEASFKRGKGKVGMDAYQVRTWQGWHHHKPSQYILYVYASLTGPGF